MRGAKTAWAHLWPVWLVAAALAFAPAGVAAPARAPAHPATKAVSNAPVVTEARVMEEGGATRLEFDFSGPTSAQSFLLANPNRLIVDLPEANFQIEPNVGLPARLRGRKTQQPKLTDVIASFRFGLLAPGKSRIVVDLAQPAKAARVTAEPIAEANGPTRLTIELKPVDRATFQSLAAQDSRRDAPTGSIGAEAPRAPTPPKTGKPVVVIDAGHGGVDTGAVGEGHAVEKTIVFDFSRLLAAKLEATGRFQVVMTRKSDIFIPLGDRVKIARAAQAALFVSIHADMLPEGASVTGATVYTVSDRASDAEAARIAEQENQADAAAGHEADETMGDVADILFDLTRRETRAYSHVFARSLVERWRQSAKLNKNPQRSAGFRVLKAPDVPSVLLELGYLSSAKDVENLVSPEWREKTATTVADAITQFFAARSPDKAEASDRIDATATGAVQAASGGADRR